MEDKQKDFEGTKEWIGSVEVALILDAFCDIPGKIIHANSGIELENIFQEIKGHFENKGSPIMMGGNLDASSKGIFGTCENPDGKFFLVLDPHYVKSKSKSIDPKQLVELGWAKWINLNDFSCSSFYNLCLPQVK